MILVEDRSARAAGLSDGVAYGFALGALLVYLAHHIVKTRNDASEDVEELRRDNERRFEDLCREVEGVREMAFKVGLRLDKLGRAPTQPGTVDEDGPQ